MIYKINFRDGQLFLERPYNPEKQKLKLKNKDEFVGIDMGEQTFIFTRDSKDQLSGFNVITVGIDNLHFKKNTKDTTHI